MTTASKRIYVAEQLTHMYGELLCEGLGIVGSDDIMALQDWQQRVRKSLADRLVRATNQSRVHKHLALGVPTFDVRIATQEELVRLCATDVEDAP